MFANFLCQMIPLSINDYISRFLLACYTRRKCYMETSHNNLLKNYAFLRMGDNQPKEVTITLSVEQRELTGRVESECPDGSTAKPSSTTPDTPVTSKQLGVVFYFYDGRATFIQLDCKGLYIRKIRLHVYLLKGKC